MFNATYLAAIEHLDDSLGRLLGALDEMKQRNNTLVVFLTDNGGLDTNYHLPEVSDGSRPLQIKTQEFDNSPLRAGKGSPYEGGIRVPCIVRWPGHVSPGRVCNTPVHVVDWMPTLLAASGASSPAHHRLDGANLLPLFDGGTIAPRTLFWYLPLYDLRWAATPCAVIRQGDWKLIESFGDWFDDEPRYHVGSRLELFNLREDPGELVDRSTSESVRAANLSIQLRDWMRSIPVPIPGDNPHFDPTRQFEETKVKPEWLK